MRSCSRNPQAILEASWSDVEAAFLSSYYHTGPRSVDTMLDVHEGQLQFFMNVDGVANVILTSTMLQLLMDVDGVVNIIMTIETFVIFIFVA
jgi:hypothetical protein